MNGNTYDMVKLYKKKYPNCVTWWRLKKHSAIIDRHLNPNERIEYVVAGQLNNNPWGFFDTCVLAITSERLIIAQDRIPVGYYFSSITPDLYNDLQVSTGLFWGTLCIDTVKEKVFISNLDKRSLPEVETNVTMFMQEAKKKYAKHKDKD